MAFTPDLGGYTTVDPEVAAICRGAVEVLEGLGTTVDEATVDVGGMHEAYHLLRGRLQADFGHGIGDRLGQTNDDVRWNVRFGQELTGAVLEAALDLGLPDIDGREVCRRIRDRSQVPIIVVTAAGDELEECCDAHVRIDRQVFRQVTQALLHRLRILRQRLHFVPTKPVGLGQNLGPSLMEPGNSAIRPHPERTVGMTE